MLKNRWVVINYSNSSLGAAFSHMCEKVPIISLLCFQLPKLFNGCHFFVTNNVSYKMPNCSFTRANVLQLIKTGGGVVSTRHPDPEAIPAAEQTVPYHASRNGPLSLTSHFIIYSPGKGEPELKYNMKHCKTLSIEWLIHCILNWRLMDP